MKRISLLRASLLIGLIFSPMLAFGAGLFFIDSNGNMGIGNITPQHRLDVSGAMYSRLTTASSSVDWNAGNVQTITLASSPTLTFSNGQAGGEYTLILNQDQTGGRSVTWPDSVKWQGGIEPTLTTDASSTDMAKFVYNGTSYLGTFTADYRTHQSQSIAFDESSQSLFSDATSTSHSHTASGSNRILIAGLYVGTSSDVSPSCSYGGSAMTQIGTQTQGSQRVYLFYRIAPTAGSHSISCSWTGSLSGALFGASYTGAKQTGQPDSFAAGGQLTSVGNYTLNVYTTVSTANSWLVGFIRQDTNASGSGPASGTTEREMYKPDVYKAEGIVDSNGTVGTGSRSLGYIGNEAGVVQSLIVAAIAPVP